MLWDLWVKTYDDINRRQSADTIRRVALRDTTTGIVEIGSSTSTRKLQLRVQHRPSVRLESSRFDKAGVKVSEALDTTISRGRCQSYEVDERRQSGVMERTGTFFVLLLPSLEPQPRTVKWAKSQVREGNANPANKKSLTVSDSARHVAQSSPATVLHVWQFILLTC